MTRHTTRSSTRLTAIAAGLALAAALVITPAADAQRRGGFDRAERGGGHGAHHRGHRGHHGGGDMLPLGALGHRLELTDAQKEQAKALGETFRETTEPLREEIHANHQELKTLLDGNGASATQVGELMLEIDAARDQIAIQRDGLIEDFKEILTPEQLERFEEFQERWQERQEARQERRADRFGDDS
jgi:Spy/CpxP family protein refolding chaperone